MIYNLIGEITHIIFFVYLIRIKWLICFNYITGLNINCEHFSKNVGFSDKFNFLLLLLTFNMIFCLKGEIKPVIFFVVTIRIKLHLFVNEIQCFDLDIDDSIKNVFFFDILIFYLYFNIWCDFTLYWGNIIHSFHRHKNVHQLAPFIW